MSTEQDKADRVRVLCSDVAGLLAEPHPGLFTWTSMLIDKSRALHELLGSVLKTTVPAMAAQPVSHTATLRPFLEPPTHQIGAPFVCENCHQQMVEGHMCVRLMLPNGSYLVRVL